MKVIRNESSLILLLAMGVVSMASAATTGADYLIITNDGFYHPDDPDDPLSALKYHKEHAKGLSVKIVRLSEIPQQHPGDRVEDIRTFLRGARSWSRAPRYLLLAGDYEFVPARTRLAGANWGSFSLEYEVVTDHYFANLDYTYLPATDPLSKFVHNYPVGQFKTAELLVGRLPADSVDMLRVMVDKIIGYEKSGQEPWQSDILMTSMFDDDGHRDMLGNKIPGTELDYKEDSPFIQTSQGLFSYMWFFANHMNIDREYSYYPYDTSFVDLKGLWGFPLSETAQDLIASGDIDTKRKHVIDKINDGVLLYTYRGHGNTNWEPFGVHSHLDELTNADKLPVAINVGCLMGAFQSTSLGERLLAKSGGGAVGFIGPTMETNSGYNDELYTGIFKAMWPGYGATGTRKLGEVLFNAKVYMNDNYNYMKYSPMLYLLGMEQLPAVVVALTPSLWGSWAGRSGREYLMLVQTEAYNLLGDPEMDIHVPQK